MVRKLRYLFRNTSISEYLENSQVFSFWLTLFTRSNFVRFRTKYEFRSVSFEINALPAEIIFVDTSEFRMAKLPSNALMDEGGVSLRSETRSV